MTPEEEIERFFAGYSGEQRKWVERSEEYQIALKRGKTTTAIEIASAVLSYFNTGDRNKMKCDIAAIFKKEFPEIELSN